MLPTRHSHDVGQLLAAHSVGPVPSGLQRTESSIERIMERPVPVHFSEYSKPQAGSVRSRRYGAKFQNGFAAFLQSQVGSSGHLCAWEELATQEEGGLAGGLGRAGHCWCLPPDHPKHDAVAASCMSWAQGKQACQAPCALPHHNHDA